MTVGQKKALIMGAMLIAAVAIYPPWVRVVRGSGGRVNRTPLGYSWIATPPQELAYGRMDTVRGAEIDITRLAVQLVAIGGLVAASFVVSKPTRK